MSLRPRSTLALALTLQNSLARRPRRLRGLSGGFREPCQLAPALTLGGKREAKAAVAARRKVVSRRGVARVVRAWVLCLGPQRTRPCPSQQGRGDGAEGGRCGRAVCSGSVG